MARKVLSINMYEYTRFAQYSVKKVWRESRSQLIDFNDRHLPRAGFHLVFLLAQLLTNAIEQHRQFR